MPQSSSDHSGEQLLHELEALSHALHRRTPTPNPNSSPPSNSKGPVYRLPRHRHLPPPPQNSLGKHSAGTRSRKTVDPPEKRSVSSSSSANRPGPQLWRSQSLDKKFDMASKLQKEKKDLGTAKKDQGSPKDLGLLQRQSSDQETEKDKKNFWRWRPFRAVSQMAQQRFHCIFSLHVHRIEGLPASMNGLRLAVNWSRKEEGLQTVPVKVLEGSAKFEEILRQRCTIHGMRNGNDETKYESKLFAVSVVALDADKLEFGKQQFDLTRLLPEHERSDPANAWKTSFKLTGIAKGSTLFLTFNYDLVHHDSTEDGDGKLGTVIEGAMPLSSPPTLLSNLLASRSDQYSVEHLSLNEQGTSQTPSIPAHVDIGLSPILGLADLHSGANPLFEFKPTFKFIPQSSDQEKFTILQPGVQDPKGREDNFPAEGKGMEGHSFSGDSSSVNRKPTIGSKVLSPALQLHNLVSNPHQEDMVGGNTVLKDDLDEEVDLVAGEFLDLLDIGGSFRHSNSGSEPESPNGRILKHYEHGALFGGKDGMGFEEKELSDDKLIGIVQRKTILGSSHMLGMEGQNWGLDDATELAEIMEAAESELQKAAQTMRSKSRAKVLEDAETQALMQEWGLSEKSFEASPPKLLAARASEPPALGRGLGPVIDLKDGGALRSMSPAHFPKNRSRGSLAMQVSRPVVVPSGAGSSAVDVLRHLASFGTENLARQAVVAMPLEDIAGKTAQEVAGTGMFKMHGFDQASSQYGNTAMLSKGKTAEDISHNGRYDATAMLDDYVSLEDVAPLAMQNIEALAIDGLKIQVDMAEEEAPSYLDAAAWGVLDDMKKRDKNNIGLSQGVAGMHFSTSELVDDASAEAKHGGLLSMAISLEDWTKLDAGVYDDTDASKEKTLAILDAHNAKHTDLALSNFDSRKGRPKSKGIMGNTLMIAMLVQLRDPLQNFEPIGAPMMALIQAERVMMPPKPRVWKQVSAKGNSEEADEEKEAPRVVNVEAPQFKVTGVHMSGLIAKDNEAKSGEVQKKGWWGNQKQQQSGSRWLVGQGMGKSSKHSLLKSKPAATLQTKGKPSDAAQTKVKPGDTLWSISSRVLGSGNKWRDLAKLNPHIRNPDVILPNDTIRTK